MTDTYVSAASGEQLIFRIEDPANPGTYLAICSINTDRKVEFSNEVWSGKRANCTDPTKPAKTVRRITATDVKFTGSGMTDCPSFARLLVLKGSIVNAELEQDLPDDAAHAWLLTGQWVIETITTGGTYGEDQAFDISVSQADGLTLSIGGVEQ